MASSSRISVFLAVVELIVTLPLIETGQARFSPRVTLSEEFEVIYNFTTEHCANGLERLSYDVPDGPPRIFRSPKIEGLYLQFASVSSGSRGQQGPSIESLRHSCRVYVNSTLSVNTSLFSSNEMPFSPWVTDDDTVYAVTDMEFHNATVGFGGVCLYVATTLFKSTDGGLTFHHALAPPAHVVASMPYPPASYANATRRPPLMPAFRAVGNVLRRDDGYLYATVSALWGPEPYGLQQQGVCIMRTDNISDPASWRGWDGESFSAIMQAFWWEHPDPKTHTCKPVLPSNMTHSTLFYSTVYERFVVLGTSPKWAYFSHDLTHWENATKITGSTETQDLYSFVIDPSQPGPNYYTVGSDAYYFYVTFLGPWPAGRNILRRKVHFELD